jgi:hypothetical protein
VLLGDIPAVVSELEDYRLLERVTEPIGPPRYDHDLVSDPWDRLQISEFLLKISQPAADAGEISTLALPADTRSINAPLGLPSAFDKNLFDIIGASAETDFLMPMTIQNVEKYVRDIELALPDYHSAPRTLFLSGSVTDLWERMSEYYEHHNWERIANNDAFISDIHRTLPSYFQRLLPRRAFADKLFPQ